MNPAEEIVPSADPLEGSELERFLAEMPVLEAQWSMMSGMELPVPEVIPVSADSAEVSEE